MGSMAVVLAGCLLALVCVLRGVSTKKQSILLDLMNLTAASLHTWQWAFSICLLKLSARTNCTGEGHDRLNETSMVWPLFWQDACWRWFVSCAASLPKSNPSCS